ncbi:MAG: ROK family protein, partial [Lancefieldella rimae]
MQYVLGIDIGGTSIKIGLFTPDGELLTEEKVPTPALTSPEAYCIVCDSLEEIVASRSGKPEDVIACGLDIPGPVADDGTVGLLANVEINPEGLVQAISSALPNATVAFVNDANAAALGEA